MSTPNRKPLVWSYSFLNDYENCPKKAQARYVTKEMPYVESPEAAYGNKVHSIGENCIRLSQYPSIPDHGLTRFLRDIYTVHANGGTTPIEPEAKLGVTRDWQAAPFFGDGVWGRGKLDVPILLKGDSAMLMDWKTGKVREDPKELAVQAVLLKAKYPHLKVIKGCYIWLKEDKYGTVHDLSDTEATKDWIESVMYKVGQELWYADPNPLCGWCDLKTCKHNKKKG